MCYTAGFDTVYWEKPSWWEYVGWLQISVKWSTKSFTYISSFPSASFIDHKSSFQLRLCWVVSTVWVLPCFSFVAFNADSSIWSCLSIWVYLLRSHCDRMTQSVINPAETDQLPVFQLLIHLNDSDGESIIKFFQSIHEEGPDLASQLTCSILVNSVLVSSLELGLTASLPVYTSAC